MNRRSRLLTAAVVAALLCGIAPSASYAKDDEPHGGVEPGTHPSVELPESTGGATGSGPSDLGTLVIYEDAPPIDPGAVVYPDTEDSTPARIHTSFGGMTEDERVSVRGGKGGEGSTGADKATDGRTVRTTMTVRNSDAGKARTPRPVAFQTFTRGSDSDTYGMVTLNTPRDLETVARVSPVASSNPAGVSTVFAYSIVFDPTVDTDYQEGVIRNIFRLTGGAFSQCTSHENYNFCTIANPKTINSTKAPLSTVPRERSIPICSNTMKDGGFGMTTVFSVADVDCEAVPGKEPVRLEVGTIYSDGSLGLPTPRAGDGAIVYVATASAGGSYVTADVWAVAADGTYSMPFTIAIRNRYAPVVAPSADDAPVEAIRGVDTVIPASRVFSDVDVDQHAVASGDHLASTVTDQGAMGGAWFDSAGNLHYRSIDVIRGEYTDHITVRTVDSFGLPSPELRLSIHIADIVPGCATDTATTDTSTPIRIQLDCWITPVEGWRQIDGLTYRLTEQPAYGTVSEVDPVSGTALYTPDTAHLGPVSIAFTATNNGASRTTLSVVNVLSAP